MRIPLLFAGLAGFLVAAPPVLGPGHSLTPLATWTDGLGQTHTRYQHRYQGIPVWGSTLIDHQGPRAAEPTARLALASVDGPLNPAPWGRALERLTRPNLTAEAVLYPVVVDIPAQGPGEPPNALLVDRTVVAYRPATHIVPEPSLDGAGEDDFEFVVDNETGAVLEQIPVNPTLTPAKAKGLSLYSGTVTLDTWGLSDKGPWFLSDTTRSPARNTIYDFSGTDGLLTKVPVERADTGPWGDGKGETSSTPVSSPTRQTMAVDLAYGIQKAWDYFSTIHKRDGADGKRGRVDGYTHYAKIRTPPDNAMWSSKLSTIAVTMPRKFLPAASLPNIAHEFTHGVVNATAALTLTGEPGALDEATADIFGTMTQTWAANGSGTTIGDAGTIWRCEQFKAGPGGAPVPVTLRNFIDPQAVSPGQKPSPAAWTPDLKALEIHRGAGPMTRAFHFLSQGSSALAGAANHSPLLPGGMAGLGNDASAAIWYRALTTYLTSSSGYAEARSAALRAAHDLYGGPAEAAVANAFAAVGVGAPLDEPGTTPALGLTVTTSGTDLVLTAVPSGVRTVKATHFFVDSIYVGSDTGNPARLTLDAPRLLGNGRHTASATVFSPAGRMAQAPDAYFTLDQAVQQLLLDPGFEAGGFPWGGLDRAALALDPDGRQAHGGKRWVRFGPPQMPSGFRQRISIPEGAAYAKLRFWARVEAAPSTPGEAFTVVRLEVPNPVTGLSDIVPLLELKAENPRPAWTQHEYDLTAYRGKTITLEVRRFALPAVEATFHFDDFQVLVSPTSQVAVTALPATLDFWEGGTATATLATTVAGTLNQTVAWTLPPDGGALSGATYTQPTAPGSYTLRAVSAADPAAADTVSVLVRPSLALRPSTATVAAGGTVSLVLEAAPGITATSAAATGSGTSPGTALLSGTTVTYVAPATPGAYGVEVTDAAGHRATCAVNVVPPLEVTLEPATATLATGAGLQFTASVQGDPSGAVRLSLAEGEAAGNLSPSGLYAAPLAPGTFHVVATSVLDPSRSAVATVVVTATLAIDPPAATLLTGATRLFSATVPGRGDPAVVWSATGGTFRGDAYTAPATPGTYVIEARSAADPSLRAQATVTVTSSDLDGDGQVTLDWDDLARLADAWGGTGADLDGDGKVDDADAELLLARFGGNP